jgi:DASH complex subunit Hsk3 like
MATNQSSRQSQSQSHTSQSRPSSANSTNSSSTNKTRQFAHLNAQLAQLNAHLADTENLMRITAVQARDMRFLGGYVGALFMGSARVLGEESVQGRGGGDGTGQGRTS